MLCALHLSRYRQFSPHSTPGHSSSLLSRLPLRECWLWNKADVYFPKASTLGNLFFLLSFTSPVLWSTNSTASARQQVPKGMRRCGSCFMGFRPFLVVVPNKSELLAYPRTKIHSVIPEWGNSIWELWQADPSTPLQNCWLCNVGWGPVIHGFTKLSVTITIQLVNFDGSLNYLKALAEHPLNLSLPFARQKTNKHPPPPPKHGV